MEYQFLQNKIGCICIPDMLPRKGIISTLMTALRVSYM